MRLFLVLASVFFLFASDVQAQRVALVRFSGPQGPRMESLLRQNLEENGYEVVPSSEVRGLSREMLGRAAPRSEDMPALAEQLMVQAFLTGRVRRRGRSWAMTVAVRSAADGERVGTATWSGRTLGALRAIRRNGSRRLQEGLSMAQGPSMAPAENVQPIQEPVGQPWYTDNAPEPEPEPEPEPLDAAPYDGVRVGLHLAAVRRSMSTKALVNPLLRGGAAGAPISESREYLSSGIGHPEAGISIELYPGALLERPVVPWLGVAFTYRNSLFVQTNGSSCVAGEEPTAGRQDCPAAPVPTAVATSQREIYGGFRVDYRVSKHRRGPNISVDLGLGSFQFNLDVNDLARLSRGQIVAPMDYRYINLGAGIRHDVVGDGALTLGVRAAYRFGFDVGTDTKVIWGTATRSFNAFLIGADFEHEMSYIAEGVFARLSVDYFLFRTLFSGQPNCFEDNCNDQDLWEQWPAGGGLIEPVSDTYLRLGLTVGYVFRGPGVAAASEPEPEPEPQGQRQPVWPPR